MWNSAGGGMDGGFGGGNDGGFMNSQGQFASPAGQSEKKSRRSQNLVPITIKTILDSGEENLRIAGTDVHMIIVVGLIRAVDVTSTKITYTIDDTTGIVEAVQWIDSDQEGEDTNRGPLMEMTYCRVAGSVRSQQGKRHLMVFRITPITDLNLITTHILEVMHATLKLQQLETMQAAGGSVGGTSGVMSNSLVGAGLGDGGGGGVNMGSFSGMQGLSAQQRQVYQVIHQCPEESGIGKDTINNALRGKLSRNQIDDVLEFLSGEGHIYSTIDDDHFRTTDS